jgi:hypothetical protein
VRTASSRPPSRVASATRAVAVVARKIHAPGLRMTATTPREAGGRDRLGPSEVGSSPAERKVSTGQVEEEDTSGHLEDPQGDAGGGEQRKAKRQEEQEEPERSVSPDHRPQPAAHPPSGLGQEEDLDRAGRDAQRQAQAERGGRMGEVHWALLDTNDSRPGRPARLVIIDAASEWRNLVDALG